MKPHENENWRVRDGQLYFHRSDPLRSSLLPEINTWKLVIPIELRKQVLCENHDNVQAGHFGREKTYHRIAENYFWPGVYSDVMKYVGKCVKCQKTKPSNQPKIGLMGKRIIEEPWVTVATDIMGPLPLSRNRNRYILVFIDLFTKWVEIIPIKKADGKTIEAEFHKRIISRWGTPRIFLSDNGTEFVNKTMRILSEKFAIRHVTTPRYFPLANPTERYNRTIKTVIRAFLEEHNSWDVNLDDVQFALNTSKNSSTNFTPAFLNLGRELQPVQTLKSEIENSDEIEFQEVDKWTDRLRKLQLIKEEVQKNLNLANERQAKNYNLNRRMVELNEGDLVLKKNKSLSNKGLGIARKLQKDYEGPFKIIGKTSDTIFELGRIRGKSIGFWNVNDLKKFIE